MEMLTQRQEYILDRVVDTHIETAQPVGSRSITERYLAALSPATVRNEMGILEDRGYLAHTHTSSGRVPTDSGYRYYVDHFLRIEAFPGDFFKRLENSLYESAQGLESFVEAALSALSSLTEEPSFVLLPDPPYEALEKAKRVRLMLRGSSLILEKPEFQNIEKIRDLFRVLEEKIDLVDRLVKEGFGQKVAIRIGEENELPALRHCTLVSTPYYLEGREVGAVAVLGPRRMRYARAVPLVDHMARLISEAVIRFGPD